MNNHPFGAKTTLRLWLVMMLVTVFAVSASTASHSVNSTGDPEKQVREFIAAFNARDIDLMLGLADENIQWLMVDGAKVSVETEGKAALRESMVRYFRGCPSCKSSLQWMQKAGGRVTAMERASWTGKNGVKSQSSLSVYEFRADKILRVYYFPAEVNAPKPATK